MADLEDFEIDPKPGDGDQQEEAPPPPPRPVPLWGLVAGGVLLVAALAVLFFVVLRPGKKVSTVLPPEAFPQATPATSAPLPLAGLPSLAESDAFVRDLAKGLSSHPQLGAWLAARDLLRTLAVVVQNVAEGRSPARFLPFLTPTARFQAVARGGALVADPRSFAAYDDFASAVASLDAAECARVYAVVAPLVGAAYAELGYPSTDFPKALGEAIDVLVKTPVPAGDIALRRGAVFLEFADPRLESLALAQKHVLRMGPANARKVQAKAVELSRALGLAAPPEAAAQR
jgi:hypothetical protein